MSHNPMTEEEARESARLIVQAYTPESRPAVRRDVAALLERHQEEARHYASTPYVPQADPVRPTEPMPAWAKGIALAAPTTGAGAWLALEGVRGVLEAVSVELAAALGVGGLFLWLVLRAAAQRGPRKVVNDYRGSTINNRKSSGVTYKSNNG
ncbi:hypothetical protein [Streptomyces sp. NPDC126933]|uniref:hypothetical protein n=1 Tax=unclassified Streptomyces TaxID=2593676 RepID=UPI003663F6CC